MPPRATRSTRNPAHVVENATSGTTEPEDVEYRGAPPTKKRKRTAKAGTGQKANSGIQSRHIKGRRGLLRKLVTDAPLDVVFEVFAYLSLPDLLALSRSSKDLRSLLLNKANPGIEGLWKQVRSSTLSGEDSPKKPEDISEPAFASLLFDKTCMDCGTVHKLWPSFIYKRRLCPKCFQKECISWKEAYDIFQESIFGLESNEISRQCSFYQYIPAYYAEGDYRSGHMYSRGELQLLMDGYKELRVQDQSQESRISWLEHRAASQELKEQFTSSWVSWLKTRREERRNDRSDLRKQRFDQIVHRLRELGWGPDLEVMISKTTSQLVGNLWDLKCVNKSQALKDRIWANIRGEILAFMEDAHENNLRVRNIENRRARLKILSAARKRSRETISTDILIPPLQNIAILPRFAEVIEKDILESTFPNDAFDALFDESFLSFCNEWLEAEIRALYPAHTGGTTIPLRLRLAARYVTCSNECRLDRNNRQLPSALYHNCYKYYGNYELNDLSAEDRIHKALEVREGSLQIWTWRHAPKFLRLCGLDPKVATQEDVMQLNPLFLCVPCGNEFWRAPYNQKMVLNFPAAIKHGMNHHNDSEDDIEYLVVTDDDKKRLELGAEAEVIQRCCISRCRAKVKYQEVSSHMSQCHGHLKFMPGTFFAVDDEIETVEWSPLDCVKTMKPLTADSVISEG